MRNLRICNINNARFPVFNAQIARCAALTLSLHIVPISRVSRSIAILYLEKVLPFTKSVSVYLTEWEPLYISKPYKVLTS